MLISNKLDNGKGLARTTVFRHKHEILCGKTSTISHQVNNRRFKISKIKIKLTFNLIFISKK